jgi:NAD-dependent dihydropyrimidine dehydrogenase PreA subunit
MQYAIVCSCTVEQSNPGLLAEASAQLLDRGYRLLQLRDLCAGVRDHSVDWERLSAAGRVPVVAACQGRALGAMLTSTPEASPCIGCKNSNLDAIRESCEAVPPARVFAESEALGNDCAGNCSSGCCDDSSCQDGGCDCDSGCCDTNGSCGCESADDNQAVATPCACEEASADQQTSFAWFPVIDPDTCNHCGQCLDFCLFGVFERHDKQVSVVAPENCKPDCPACARVCPQQAIYFPKHPQSPIDGGEAPDETPRHDLRDLLAGDLRSTLAKRSPKHKGRRFSLQQNREQAETERHQHLMDLAAAAGLDDEMKQLMEDRS